MRFPCPRPGPRHATERVAGRILAVPLLLAASLFSTPAAAGWWDDVAEARGATLAELREDPERWRDVPVLLDVRFGGAGSRVNPYFTQFAPERWQPVDLLPPAGAPDAERLLRTAFVARGGRDDLRLATISPNLRVRVRAVVRDAVQGEPWLEILSFVLSDDPLTPEEATRVREADRFLASRNAEAAERLYRGVLDGRRLDRRDRADLLRRLGVALHDQRRPHDALATFREALALDPDDLDARHRAQRLEASLARTPLPRGAADDAPLAGRAAPTTPEAPVPTDAPLLLPGRTPALAPPRGLPSGGGTAPGQGGTPPAQEPTARPVDAPPRPGVSPPEPGTARPPVLDERPEASGSNDDEVQDGDEDAEPDEDAPPPVPPRPRLSGPK